jgi:hypothetical protein
MQYVLGNMLNGGGGLNADGLSLDLQFAADKTLTARKGPTPTFTRASAATYYGPLVQFGGQTYPSTGIVGGRTEWKIVNGSDYESFFYSGGVWRYEVFIGGEGTTYDSAATTAFRPEQANWSASGLEFSPTTSSTFGIVRAATNEPRFDHTSAGVCRGLLIEESRTNSQPHSSDYTQTATSWSTTTGMNASVLNSTTAPDGTQGGVLVSENTANTVHRISSAGITATAQPYTSSIFVKAGSSPRRYVSFGFVFQNIRVIWDTQTSSFVGVTPGTTAPTSYSSQDFGNGWHRIIVTATPAAGNIGIGALLYNGVESYAGNGTSNVFLWGAQLEAGSFATSYIPTTTGSVVRSADVCSITGADFTSFYNQSEGTLFADVFGLMTDLLVGNRGFAVITDGTYNNAIGIYKAANAALIRAEGTTGNMPQFALTNAYAQFTQYKVALGVKTNDTNAAFNGSLKTTDTSVTLPSTMNKLEFRDPTAAAGGQPSCHLAAIRYYRKRLPNAKLVALTT